MRKGIGSSFSEAVLQHDRTALVFRDIENKALFIHYKMDARMYNCDLNIQRRPIYFLFKTWTITVLIVGLL